MFTGLSLIFLAAQLPADRRDVWLPRIIAVLLLLPIPFANGLLVLSILVLALGLGERDGCWMAGEIALTRLSAAVVSGIVYLGAFAVLELPSR